MTESSKESVDELEVGDRDGDDGLYIHPFDLAKELALHKDLVLGFALCNMDHHGTRRDVKKAQEHIAAILTAMSHPPHADTTLRDAKDEYRPAGYLDADGNFYPFARDTRGSGKGVES